MELKNYNYLKQVASDNVFICLYTSLSDAA